MNLDIILFIQNKVEYSYKVDRLVIRNRMGEQANHFAAGFLLEISRMHREGRHLLEMASQVYCTKDAMRVRLKFLGL